MAFERSALGQQNRGLFMDVDATVYCEGGDEPTGKKESFDLMYWSKIFRHFKPDLRVKFLARGRKETLLDIANENIKDDVKNVFVTMDSDYDFVSGAWIDDSRVFYTFGYSLENEIWTTENVIRAFYNLCPIHPTELSVHAETQELIAYSTRELMRYVRLDYACVRNGQSVLPRDNVLSIFREGRSGLILERSIMTAKIRELKAWRHGAGRSIHAVCERSLSIPRDIVGKVVDAIGFYVLRTLLKKHSELRSVPKRVACSVVIQSAAEALQDTQDTDFYAFYKNQFERRLKLV